MLKSDAEGMEVRVLRGASQVLAMGRRRRFLFFEFDLFLFLLSGTSAAQLLQSAHAAGFACAPADALNVCVPTGRTTRTRPGWPSSAGTTSCPRGAQRPTRFCVAFQDMELHVRAPL